MWRPKEGAHLPVCSTQSHDLQIHRFSLVLPLFLPHPGEGSGHMFFLACLPVHWATRVHLHPLFLHSLSNLVIKTQCDHLPHEGKWQASFKSMTFLKDICSWTGWQWLSQISISLLLSVLAAFCFPLYFYNHNSIYYCLLNWLPSSSMINQSPEWFFFGPSFLSPLWFQQLSDILVLGLFLLSIVTKIYL